MVRFGDHQPHFARFFLEPRLDQAAVARRIQQFDPRYFTTYYAIDAVNSGRSTPPRRSTRSTRRTCRWWCWKGRACRSIRRSSSRRDPPALPRHVLSVRRRRRGAPLQPPADRRRPDQGLVTATREIGIRAFCCPTSRVLGVGQRDTEVMPLFLLGFCRPPRVARSVRQA